MNVKKSTRINTLKQAAANYAAQKIRNQNATQALRDQVRLSAASGISEAEIARVAGITRMTVRAWLGKR